MQNLLDIEAAAERLGVSVRLMRRLVAERRIRYLKIGKFLRFSEEDLAAFMQAHAVEPLDAASAPGAVHEQRRRPVPIGRVRAPGGRQRAGGGYE